MKTKILITVMLVSVLSAFAQKSPRQQSEGTVEGTKIAVDYSSPRVKGRTIYGDLVSFEKVWRAGADTNTTVEFSENVTINGESLTAGKFGFFIIPNENKDWVAIFSKTNDAWGSYSYKKSEDALRVKVPAMDTESNVENLTFEVTDDGIKFAWADKYFVLEIE